MDKKNPWIAAILSFLVAGAGQLYLGRYRRAAIYFLIEILSAIIYLYIDPFSGQILSFAASVYSCVDAYRMAVEMNRKVEKEAGKKVKSIERKEEVYIY